MTHLDSPSDPDEGEQILPPTLSPLRRQQKEQKTQKPNHPALMVVLVMLAVLIATMMVLRHSLSVSRTRKAEEGTVQIAPFQPAAPTQPAPAPFVPASQRPWTTRTIEIPPDQDLEVFLYQGAETHPVGGGVTITTPRGEVFHDRPGIHIDMGFQPNGVYTFRADPKGSTRSVTIKNRW